MDDDIFDTDINEKDFLAREAEVHSKKYENVRKKYLIEIKKYH